jgi:hypothetical protein
VGVFIEGAGFGVLMVVVVMVVVVVVEVVEVSVRSPQTWIRSTRACDHVPILCPSG